MPRYRPPARRSSKAALGGGFTLLIVIAIGLKIFLAVNKASRNSDPTSSSIPAKPPAPATPLRVPPATPPVVKGSALNLSDWSIVTLGKFRVYAPSDPEVTELPEKDSKSSTPGRRWTWRLNNEEFRFLAEYRHEDEVMDLADPEPYLDSLAEGLTRRSTNVTTRVISLRGVRGREVSGLYESGMHMRGRLFLDGRHRYMLLSLMGDAAKDDPVINAFFDSFDFAGR